MTHDKKIAKIDEYISKAEELLNKNYDEGKDELEELITKARNFLNYYFGEHEKLLGEFDKAARPPGIVADIRMDSQREQESYENKLKGIKNNLESWKEILSMED